MIRKYKKKKKNNREDRVITWVLWVRMKARCFLVKLGDPLDLSYAMARVRPLWLSIMFLSPLSSIRQFFQCACLHTCPSNSKHVFPSFFSLGEGEEDWNSFNILGNGLVEITNFCSYIHEGGVWWYSFCLLLLLCAIKLNSVPISFGDFMICLWIWGASAHQRWHNCVTPIFRKPRDHIPTRSPIIDDALGQWMDFETVHRTSVE